MIQANKLARAGERRNHPAPENDNIRRRPDPERHVRRQFTVMVTETVFGVVGVLSLTVTAVE